MLHYETILPSTLGLLRKLQSIEVFNSMRLVGGTALALQLGHRISVDLDFFGYNITEDFIFIINEIKSKGCKIELIRQSSSILIANIDNIKVDIVNYPYNWIDKARVEDEIILATNKDIAAMKLAAITNRGTKKDFIDLYFLLNIYSLSEMISFYKEKYDDGSVFMLVKSLSYFDDADTDLMPKMFDKSFNWKSVKLRVLEETQKIV